MSHNVIPCWFGYRSRIHPCRNFTKHSRVLQNFLHSVEPFFLVEGNGKKNSFHRIVVTLIGGGLGVVAHADKEPVEMFVVFSESLVAVKDKRIRACDYVEAAPNDLLAAVREQGLEGIIGKQKDSHYQPGKRSGAWIKYRVNRGQEFVIGGYFPGPHGFDSLIVGYYDGEKLMYVARTRNGFVPASRRQVFSKLKHLVTAACPFVNLPETRRSRFGEELNAEKMKKAVWLRPEAVAQIEFLEWTEGDRLRHSKFGGLREDKNPRSVVREPAGEP